MDHDPMLAAGFHGAVAALDITARAWVVVVGRLIDLEPRGPFSTNEMNRLIEEATAAGDLPSGPISYALEHSEYEVNADYQMLTVRSRLDGEDYLESKVAFGVAGFLAEGFTRSGRLDGSGAVNPSHVLFADFESVVADTIVLLSRAASLLGHTGPGRIMVGIAADVPGHPLTLRALSEETGALLPAGTPVDEFEPVTLDLMIGGSRSEAHRICYDAMTQVAPRFGVTRPQYFTDPALGTADYGLGEE